MPLFFRQCELDTFIMDGGAVDVTCSVVLHGVSSDCGSCGGPDGLWDMEVGDAFRAVVAAELAVVPLDFFGADFVAFEAQTIPIWLRLEVICEGVPSRLLVAATFFSSFILDSLQHAAAACRLRLMGNLREAQSRRRSGRLSCAPRNV